MRSRLTADMRFGIVCTVPALALLVVTFAIPIAKVILMSLQNLDLLAPPGVRGSFVGLENYVAVLGSAEFQTSVVRLVTFVGASVIGQFTIGLALALSLNRVARGSGVARGLLLMPWIIPSAAMALVWLFLFNPYLGLVNYILSSLGLVPPNQVWLQDFDTAMISVVTVSIWRGFPFQMLVLLAALQTVPREMHEAAAVDGASSLQRFRHVTVPFIRYVMALSLAIGMIWQIQSYVTIRILTQGGPGDATEITPLLIYRTAFERAEFGEAAAMAVVLLVLSVLATLVLLRVVLKGARP